jgi:hypothetical protein
MELKWKLIMSVGLIKINQKTNKRERGGLSRLLELGYAKDVYKLILLLYPKIEITHGIFPNLDISGVMEGILTYVVDTVIILSLQVQKRYL